MKKIVSTLFLFISITSLFAAERNEQELILETVVPENYGIHVPDEAITLDQFVFEFSTDNGTAELLTDSRFSIGSFEDARMQSFTLLYYGNLVNDYNVRLIVRDNGGFSLVGDNRGLSASIPVNISFSETEDTPEDIEIVDDEENGVCSVIIPPAGPRRGVDVVNLNISWEEARDLFPGAYELTLSIELLSNI